MLPADLLGLITPQLSDLDNEEFSCILTAGEVKTAMFSVGSRKAPGPDGFFALFSRPFGLWLVIRLRLQSKTSLRMENFFLKLITLTQPLFLNLQKHLKLLFGLKPLMPKLISSCQTAFVPGRQIQENVILAYECMHALKNKKGRERVMAVKLDMAKDYDSL